MGTGKFDGPELRGDIDNWSGRKNDVKVIIRALRQSAGEPEINEALQMTASLEDENPIVKALTERLNLENDKQEFNIENIDPERSLVEMAINVIKGDEGLMAKIGDSPEAFKQLAKEVKEIAKEFIGNEKVKKTATIAAVALVVTMTIALMATTYGLQMMTGGGGRG
jgi:hypothetical protein